VSPIVNYLHTGLYFVCIFFAIQLLFFKSTYGKQKKILGLLFLSFFLYYLLLAYYPDKKELLAAQYALLDFLFFSIQPLLYIYVKSLTNERFVISIRLMKHFILSLMFFSIHIVNFIFIVLGYDNIDLFIINIQLFSVGLFIYKFQFVFYMVLMYFSLRKYSILSKNIFSNLYKKSLHWLHVVFATCIVLNVLDFLLTNTDIFGNNSTVVYLTLMIGFISFLGFFGVRQNEIFTSQQTQIEAIPFDNNINHEDNIEDSVELKTYISENLKVQLFEKLIILLEEQKHYLNTSLTSSDLAKLLNTNRTYLSKVIQEKFNTNFYNLINSYRVEEAKKYLAAPEYDKYNLDGIAEMSGFASRNAFGRTFKSLTGETPTEFKNKMRNS